MTSFSIHLPIGRLAILAVAALSLLALQGCTTAAAEPTAGNKTWKVAEDVYRYGAVDGRNGYYSAFVVTDGGVIAIEPVNPEHAKGLMAAIKSVTDQPVR